MFILEVDDGLTVDQVISELTALKREGKVSGSDKVLHSSDPEGNSFSLLVGMGATNYNEREWEVEVEMGDLNGVCFWPRD